MSDFEGAPAPILAAPDASIWNLTPAPAARRDGAFLDRAVFDG
jgi:hypothetical protein